MKLTREHKKAGILRVVSKEPNTDGSYVCYVDPKRVNHTGNRPRRKNHLMRIVNNFNQKFCSNPHLIYDGKSVVSCNGQNRVAAAMLNGVNELSANIFFDMPKKESAAVFYETQSVSLKMDPWDSFNAACVAGYEWAKQIQNTLNTYGLTYPVNGLSKKDCDIKSFSVLKEAQKANLLDEFLNVYTNLYKEDETGVGKLNPFLRGLLAFLNKKDPKKVISKLSSVDLSKVASKVKQYSPISGRIGEVQYAKALEFFYNK